MTVVPIHYQQNDNRHDWISVMDRAGELAEAIANTEFVPKNLRGNQPAILAAVLYGNEVGLPPMQSLAKISVIEGRPTLSAEAQRALIFAAGHELWIEELTTAKCTVAGRRRGEKMTSRVTWTLDDAKRAKIGGRPNWQAYPRQMLLARATAELARAIFADAIGGLAATEEFTDRVEGTDTPSVVADVDVAPPRATTRRRRAQKPPADVAADPGSEGSDGAPPTDPAPADPDPPNRGQLNLMFALFNELGMGGDDKRVERLAWASKAIDRTIESSKDLTALEASRVIDALQAATAEAGTVRELREVGAVEVVPQESAFPIPEDVKDELQRRGQGDFPEGF